MEFLKKFRPFLKHLNLQAVTERRISLASCLVVHPKVEAALRRRAPVVALESAVITHGMPVPFNVQIALETEAIVEQEGAVAATVGVIKGRIHVGLTQAQIKFLAENKSTSTAKVSRRDLPFVLAKKYNGGTTVSATMVACHMTGIPIFATGGIGGVHRKGEVTLDISADLTELGRTPVAVVSAGVKSILDVGLTLEFLETQGVCVSVLGSSAFPDFFTRDSGFVAPSIVSDCEEAATVMAKRLELNLQSGILFAVPIPKELEGDGFKLKSAIEQAVAEAEQNQIVGREVTPFVLQRVNEITKGQSLTTNMGLLRNNARVAAQIAVAYANKQKLENSYEKKVCERKIEGQNPVVIGGSNIDLVSRITEESDVNIDMNGRTYKGLLSQSFGGVGRNIADALTRLQCHPLFITAVGEDSYGISIMDHTPQMDKTGFLKCKTVATATYNVLLDNCGEALVGVGDMSIHAEISPEWVSKFEDVIANCPLLILDGNVSYSTMKRVFQICNRHKTPVWYEPTDVMKSTKPWRDSTHHLWPQFTSPNLREFIAMIRHLTGDPKFAISLQKQTFHHDVLKACHAFNWSETIALMITMGADGFLIVRKLDDDADLPLLVSFADSPTIDRELVALHFKSDKIISSASVSGAGDCLAAGFISGMLQNKTISECSSQGLICSDLSLKHSEAVPQRLDSIELTQKSLTYTLIR